MVHHCCWNDPSIGTTGQRCQLRLSTFWRRSSFGVIAACLLGVAVPANAQTSYPPVTQTSYPAVNRPMGAPTTVGGVTSIDRQAAASAAQASRHGAPQATGRTSLERTKAMPWLQRFIKPRQNTGRQPSSRSASDAQRGVATTAAGQPNSPSAGPSVARTSARSSRVIGDQPTTAASHGSSRTSAGSLAGRRGPQMPVPMNASRAMVPLTNSSAASVYRSANRQYQPAQPLTTRPGSPGRSQLSGLPRQAKASGMPGNGIRPSNTQRPPNVSRVPLPKASREFLEHAAQAEELANESRGRQATTSQNSSTLEDQPVEQPQPSASAKREISKASTPAGAPQVAKIKPPTNASPEFEENNSLNRSGQAVSVPARMANVPLAERAARVEAHSRPRESRFRTAQYPAPPEPSKPQSPVAQSPVAKPSVAKPSAAKSPASEPSTTTQSSMGQGSTAADSQRSEMAARAKPDSGDTSEDGFGQSSPEQGSQRPQPSVAANRGAINTPPADQLAPGDTSDSREALGKATSMTMSPVTKPSGAMPYAMKKDSYEESSEGLPDAKQQMVAERAGLKPPQTTLDGEPAREKKLPSASQRTDERLQPPSQSTSSATRQSTQTLPSQPTPSQPTPGQADRIGAAKTADPSSAGSPALPALPKLPAPSNSLPSRSVPVPALRASGGTAPKVSLPTISTGDPNFAKADGKQSSSEPRVESGMAVDGNATRTGEQDDTTSPPVSERSAPGKSKAAARLTVEAKGRSGADLVGAGEQKLKTQPDDRRSVKSATLSPQGVEQVTQKLAAPTQFERLSSRMPRVSVDVIGPEEVPVAVPTNYQVVVTNEDQFDLQGLILRLETPKGLAVRPGNPSVGSFDVEQTADGARVLTWGFDRLNPGQTARAPVEVTSQTAADFSLGVEWTLMPISQTAKVHVLAPQLQVAMEGNTDVAFGAVNAYRLRVRNVGDHVASGVHVTIDAGEFGSSKALLGNLPAKGEEVVEVELQFKQRGKIQLSAIAEADNHPQTKSGIEVLVRQPKLAAQLNAPQIVYHGAQTGFTVTLRNVGDIAAENLNAQLSLPAGAVPVDLPYGAKQQGQILSWNIQKLDASASETFTFQLNLPAEGENVVLLNCRDQLGNSVSSRASTEVKAIPDLKLLVSDPVAPAPVGREVVYELELTNRGSKAAQNVIVVAQFSKGIEPTRGLGHGYRIVPGQLFFDPIDQIAAGETVRLKVHAIADSNGVHRFRAEVRSDEAETRLVMEESTQFLQTHTQVAGEAQKTSLR